MARLGDLFLHIRNGANIKQGVDDTGYPITRIETISNKIVDRNKMGYAGITDLSKYSDYILQDGDILMSHINSETHLGKTALYKKENDETIIHGMNLLSLRPNKDIITSEYAFYYFSSQSFLRQIPRITKKSVNQASFTVSALRDLEFPIVSLEKQKKIAERLDKVDELISYHKEQLTKLDELVKSRFIELFGDKDLPKTTIGELVTSKVSSVKKVFSPSDTIRYIDISSIDNKRNVMTGYTEFVLEEAPSRAQQYIRRGDIVVSTVRPNLKNVAITGYDYDNLVASSGFCVLRAEKCLPSYLMAVVCSDDFTDAMTKVVTGANYPAIKDSDVRNYVVPNPPIELQEQFAAFVEQTNKSKLAVQQSLEKLETLKKSLMQQYFG